MNLKSESKASRRRFRLEVPLDASAIEGFKPDRKVKVAVQNTKGSIQDTIPQDVVSVFVPTTPNPTSGYLLFVPKDQIIDIDMSVEYAMKLVISGGSVHLKDRNGFAIKWKLKKS